MWVQLTRENILTRGDLLENTRETIQRVIHLTDLVRNLMRSHMQGDEVPMSMGQTVLPISVIGDIWPSEQVLCRRARL